MLFQSSLFHRGHCEIFQGILSHNTDTVCVTGLGMVWFFGIETRGGCMQGSAHRVLQHLQWDPVPLRSNDLEGLSEGEKETQGMATAAAWQLNVPLLPTEIPYGSPA